MPIYEYRRPDGTTFEVMQSFSDDALTVDPETGVPVERVFHAPAVHFKGKGFYNTDYGKRSRQRESSDGDSGDSGADSSKSSAEGSSSSPKEVKATPAPKDQKAVPAGNPGSGSGSGS
jgi:putative FmdB family regulatory protein